jgi:hypothetical protein
MLLGFSTMAAEPMTLFSHTIDAPGVARVLRGLAPKLEMHGTDERWTRIIIRESRGLLRGPATIEFNHERVSPHLAGSVGQSSRVGAPLVPRCALPRRGRVSLLARDYNRKSCAVATRWSISLT